MEKVYNKLTVWMGISLTIFPSIFILPSVISSKPAIILKIVLLPQPEGPTKTKNSFLAISKSTPLTASVLSNSYANYLKKQQPFFYPLVAPEVKPAI